MPPPLATLLCALFVIFLFWVERADNDGVSRAIWIPFFWMFLAGSRFASQWLNILGISQGPSADVYMEGSPIDMPVFLFLIGASLVILYKRRLDWDEIFKKNYIVWAFYIFALISIVWSDYPFISFKRWLKTLGAISMALVILTEEHPFAAFGVIMRRLAFLLLPFSILFIKYYPAFGRQFHSVGTQMFTGVTTQKNQLGQLCMLLGIYFIWNLFYVDWERSELGRRLRSYMYWAVLLMIAWLLYKSDSATSLVCLIAAIVLFLTGRSPIMVQRPSRNMVFFLTCVVLYSILQLTFDINAF
jgi:exopolysaccharide production protein ExoQ